MQLRSVLLLMLIATDATPIAAASTHADAVLALVVIEDSRGDECSLRIGPTCQANATLDPSSPGSWHVDAYQRVEYVGIATNTSGIASAPDVNESVAGRDAF